MCFCYTYGMDMCRDIENEYLNEIVKCGAEKCNNYIKEKDYKDKQYINSEIREVKLSCFKDSTDCLYELS
jgi:hypothetical protein